jgi:hypothetical protein
MPEKITYAGRIRERVSFRAERGLHLDAKHDATHEIYVAQHPRDTTMFALCEPQDGSLKPLNGGRNHPVLARALLCRVFARTKSKLDTHGREIKQALYHGMNLRDSFSRGLDEAGIHFVRRFVASGETAGVGVDYRRLTNLLLAEIKRGIKRLEKTVAYPNALMLSELQREVHTLYSYLALLDDVSARIPLGNNFESVRIDQLYEGRLKEKKKEFRAALKNIARDIYTDNTNRVLLPENSESIRGGQYVKTYADFLLFSRAVSASGGARVLYTQQKRGGVISDKKQDGSKTDFRLDSGSLTRFFFQPIEYQIRPVTGEVRVILHGFRAQDDNTDISEAAPHVSVSRGSPWLQAILAHFGVSTPEELAGHEVYGVRSGSGINPYYLLGIADLPDAEKVDMDESAGFFSKDTRVESTKIQEVKMLPDGNAILYCKLSGKKYGFHLSADDQSEILRHRFDSPDRLSVLRGQQVQSVTREANGDIVLSYLIQGRRYRLVLPQEKLIEAFALHNLEDLVWTDTIAADGKLVLKLVDRFGDRARFRNLSVDPSAFMNDLGKPLSFEDVQNLIASADPQGRHKAYITSVSQGSETGSVRAWIKIGRTGFQMSVKQSDQTHMEDWLRSLTTIPPQIESTDASIKISEGLFNTTGETIVIKGIKMNDLDPVTLANMVGHDAKVALMENGIPLLEDPFVRSARVSTTSASFVLRADEDGTPIIYGMYHDELPFWTLPPRTESVIVLDGGEE